MTTKSDLVLLDAGYLSYGLLRQIHDQNASFVVRLSKELNTKRTKKLADGDEVVIWTPKDSRGQWRKEGLEKQIEVRILTYKVKGFRPLKLMTNVLDPQKVSKEQFWGLSISEQGEVLHKGLYNHRWEVEHSYRELKVEQGMEGGLRSRTAEGIRYEVAWQVLHYLLIRWLMVDAAKKAKVSPLRLSFKDALREVKSMSETARSQSEEWVNEVLRPRLLERIAEHRVPERAGRTTSRGKKQRRKAKAEATRRYKKKQRENARRQAQQAKQAKRPRRTNKDKHARWWVGLGPVRSQACPSSYTLKVDAVGTRRQGSFPKLDVRASGVRTSHSSFAAVSRPSHSDGPSRAAASTPVIPTCC